MDSDTRRFSCACTAAGKPLLCRSCQRRAGLQKRRARTGYHAAVEAAPPPPGTARR